MNHFPRSEPPPSVPCTKLRHATPDVDSAGAVGGGCGCRHTRVDDAGDDWDSVLPRARITGELALLEATGCVSLSRPS